MAGTILFVHGTGVRGERYRATLATITSQAAAHGLPEVRGVPWGDVYGAPSGAGSRSTPRYRATHGGSHLPTEEEKLAGLWAVLYTYPWFELELAAQADRPGTHAVYGDPPQQLYEQIADFQASEALKARLADLELADAFRSALSDIISCQEFFDAINNESHDLFELRRVVARALVARALTIQSAGPWTVIGPADRDEVVSRLTTDLGAEMGVWDAVTGKSKQLGWRLAESWWQSQRGAFTDKSSPLAGDIVRFLARGDEVRSYLAKQIQAVTPPVVLLGHSLGGIICVDLLCRGQVGNVNALITVGSQAPMLHELGALPALAEGAALPEHFPRWLNVYDERDMLAYLAGPVFDGATDFEVASEQPFPAAHSSYWTQPSFWPRVVEFLGHAG
jgi:pimeloyl-ACP methyl ester carboxylesterase